MKLGDFTKLYVDENGSHRLSVWESEVVTGRWLGLFPVYTLPKEYAEREIVKFSICEEEPHDGYPCLWVVIK